MKMTTAMYPDEVQEWIEELYDIREQVNEHKGPLHNTSMVIRTKTCYLLDELIETLESTL